MAILPRDLAGRVLRFTDGSQGRQCRGGASERRTPQKISSFHGIVSRRSWLADSFRIVTQAEAIVAQNSWPAATILSVSHLEKREIASASSGGALQVESH